MELHGCTKSHVEARVYCYSVMSTAAVIFKKTLFRAFNNPISSQQYEHNDPYHDPKNNNKNRKE